MILDTLRAFVRDALGGTQGEPTPGTGAPPATPSELEPLTTTTVAALRAMLDEHDRGCFLRSGLLADLLRRDADVYGALQQRLTALAAHPLCFDPADETDAAKAARDALAAAWPRVVSQGVTFDLATDEILCGFGLAQLVYRVDPESGALWPHAESWPAHAVEYDRTLRQWFVQTTTGRLAITPGDGQWVLVAPRSDRAPWLWGAIRPTGEWYLSNSYAASDGRRRSETQGQGIWKVKVPTGARESAEGKSFLRSFRNLGRAAAIPAPQGATAQESYDFELIEAKADAHKIFEWLKRAGGGAIRLAILGQDLTSQNNLVGTNASSSTGEGVTAAVVEAQARGLSEAFTTQVAAPIARYRGEPLTGVRIDAEPEEDRKALAEAAKAVADAVVAWRAAGVEVDAVKHAERVGMVGAKAREPAPAPTTTPPQQQGNAA